MKGFEWICTRYLNPCYVAMVLLTMATIHRQMNQLRTFSDVQSMSEKIESYFICKDQLMEAEA